MHNWSSQAPVSPLTHPGFVLLYRPCCLLDLLPREHSIGGQVSSGTCGTCRNDTPWLSGSLSCRGDDLWGSPAALWPGGGWGVRGMTLAPRRDQWKDKQPSLPLTHLRISADGAAAGGGGDVVGEVGGHQHGVARREGAGLAVAHAGEDHVGAFARASTVTADCDVEGWWGSRAHRIGQSTMRRNTVGAGIISGCQSINFNCD